MRKLKLQVQVTIDAFICGPNDEMDFMIMNWDQKLADDVDAFTKPVDTILLGRKLAERFIPYWDSVAKDDSNPEQESGKKFTYTPKVVFTKTLKESPWEHTVVNNGDLATEVKAIKEKEGGDIVVYGGAEFVSNLIKHNLIDEYHLFINPTAIGKGKAIFNKLESTLNLTLLKSTKYECGINVMVYKPADA